MNNSSSIAPNCHQSYGDYLSSQKQYKTVASLRMTPFSSTYNNFYETNTCNNDNSSKKVRNISQFSIQGSNQSILNQGMRYMTGNSNNNVSDTVRN